MEACRIVVQEIAMGVFDVGAPMQHKELCYEILKDAYKVIHATTDEHFTPFQNCLTIVMGMSGTVDVGAPLPPREKCLVMLNDAKLKIQRFDDAEAPVMRAFSDKLMGT